MSKFIPVFISKNCQETDRDKASIIRKKYHLSSESRQNMNDIIHCKTIIIILTRKININ